MKKGSIVGLIFCLVAALTVSVWAADMPGQKLTQAELASVTGKANPFTIPMSFFQKLSTTGTTVIINGQQIQSSSSAYTSGEVTVAVEKNSIEGDETARVVATWSKSWDI